MEHLDLKLLLVISLKELRNRILRTTLEWSLLCLIRLYVGLHFSISSFRKLVFRLSVLSLNQDQYNNMRHHAM